MGANGSSAAFAPPVPAPPPPLPAEPTPPAAPPGVPIFSNQTLSVATDTHGVPQYPSDDVVRSLLVHAPNNRMGSAVTMMAEYNSNVARLSEVNDASMATWQANEAKFVAARDALARARQANLVHFDAELRVANTMHDAMAASYDRAGANVAQVTAYDRGIVADAAQTQADLRAEASSGALGAVCRRLNAIRDGIDANNRTISSKVGANFLRNHGLAMQDVAAPLAVVGCDLVSRS